MRSRIQADSVYSATLNTQIVNHGVIRGHLNVKPMIKPGSWEGQGAVHTLTHRGMQISTYRKDTEISHLQHTSITVEHQICFKY